MQDLTPDGRAKKEVRGTSEHNKSANKGPKFKGMMKSFIRPFRAPKHQIETRQPDQTPIGKTLLEVVAVAVGASVAVIYWLQLGAMQAQLGAMNGQLAEIKSSGDDTKHLLGVYEGLSAAAQDQAAATATLMQLTGKQATDTHTLAEAAPTQANAAQSAAETARDTLHISERAYLVTGIATISDGAIALPIENTGHIPSGDVDIVIHQGIFNVSATDPAPTESNLVEYRWSPVHFSSIFPGESRHNINAVFPVSTT